MNEGPSIPVLVLSGFLGAGKSTLLNELLTAPEAERTALVINEFGEVPIDHDLVSIGRSEASGQKGRVVTTSGCICCSYGSDIRSSLHELLDVENRMNGARLARVVVETTGLVDLAPVVNQLIPGGAPAFGLRDHVVARRFHMAGCICVVDVTSVESTLDEHFECAKQIAFADVLVLTKGDLFAGDISHVTGQLRAINPVATIVDRHGRGFDVANVFEPRIYAPSNLSGDVDDWLALERVLAEEGRVPAGNDAPRHGRIRSFSLIRNSSVTYAQLSLFLELLKNAAGTRLMRLKGIVSVEGETETPLVVHAVQHNMHPLLRLDAWPSADRRTRLVLIGHDIDPNAVEKLFDALSGEGKSPPSGKTLALAVAVAVLFLGIGALLCLVLPRLLSHAA
ncbi:CobW family GTP-binding protein [Tardiphaga robiniae]|uniref:GTP-binding protein n=1 Tax=Tardiphaga robiniae TaxID=943830 RepID=A0A7G6TSU0_9BRAD|nr:GTP-binding protein [Tardiphaga robiniae]QND69822.1 GTP-binding protein [Tardiphaga robiniae]